MPSPSNAGPPPVCDYEGSDYRTRFWERGGRDYEDAAERIALRRLLPPRPARRGRLLEIGAGFGRLTGEYDGYDEVVLLDYSRTLLREARARLGASGPGGRPRYTYVAANIYQLPFTQGQFASAVMVRVIHHMADVPAALAQIRHALAPGALFVLEFANKQNLKSIARWLLRRQRWNPFDPQPIEFIPLNFDFAPDWMRARLADARFAVDRQLTVSHFRLGALKRAVPGRWLAALDGLIQPTGDWWQLAPSVFARCRAMPDALIDTARPGAGLLRCPACHTPLPVPAGSAPAGDTPAGDTPAGDTPAATALACAACGRSWPFSDGLYDFRGDAPAE
jgi:SAM-dependent methyltransferase